MSFSFNLIDEKWIPCIRSDGSRDEFGLRDVLALAHQLREIVGDTPLETVTLHRLLLVILHRVFGPENSSAWQKLWIARDKGFDTEKIIAYLEKWRHKFDLLDEKYPFFQVADESQLGQPDQINKMVTRLTMDATLFEHTLNNEEKGAFFSLAQAARMLLAIQNYGFGYQFFVDAPGVKGPFFLVEGNTLYETLIFNLTSYPQEEGHYYSGADDAPAWEYDNPFEPIVDGFPFHRDKEEKIENGKKKPIYREFAPLGYLDYLTWQNRKIKLLCLDGKTVRHIAWNPGLRVKKETLDPMQSYVGTENGRIAISFSADRSLWRDFNTLLKLSDAEGNIKPVAALVNLHILAGRYPALLPKTFHLSAFGGLFKDKGKVQPVFMRCETTPLRLEYLQQEDLLPDVRIAIDEAEKVGKLLRRCAFRMAWLILKSPRPDEKPDEITKQIGQDIDKDLPIDVKIATGKIAVEENKNVKDKDAKPIYQLFTSFGVERLYWSQLEAPFYRFLQNLPDQRETALNEWRSHLRHTAKAVFNQAQQYAGSDRRSLRASVQADEQFQRGLAWLLNVPQSPTNPGGDSHDAN